MSSWAYAYQAAVRIAQCTGARTHVYATFERCHCRPPHGHSGKPYDWEYRVETIFTNDPNAPLLKGMISSDK